MRQACQSDIDLVPAEELVGRLAHLVLDPSLRGHVIGVWVRPVGRVYTMEWCYDGALHQADFYGFQLELEEGA